MELIMLKHILSFSIFCVTSLSLLAQPTIISTDFTIPKENNRANIKYAGSLNLTLPQEGENVTWNFKESITEVQDITYSFEDYDNNPNFPDATAQFTFNAGFGSFTLEGSRTYYKQDENGYYDLGFETMATEFSLTATTFGPNDKLVIKNSFNYTPNSKILDFPLTYGKNWDYSKRETTPFNLTVGVFQLNNTPGEVVQNRTYTNKVVGYGTLTIGEYKQVPALLLKTTMTSVDSVYLAGIPAPTALLNQFQLTQGRTSTTTSYNYYISDGKTAFNASAALLTKFASGDNIVSVEYNTQMYDDGMSVENEKVMVLYPNPAESNKITLELNKESNSNWNMTLMNINGQTIENRSIINNGLVIENINLENLSNGMYLTIIKDENGKIVTSKEFIKK